MFPKSGGGVSCWRDKRYLILGCYGRPSGVNYTGDVGVGLTQIEGAETGGPAEDAERDYLSDAKQLPIVLARQQGAQSSCLDEGYENPIGRRAVAAQHYCPHIWRIGEEKLDKWCGTPRPTVSVSTTVSDIG